MIHDLIQMIEFQDRGILLELLDNHLAFICLWFDLFLNCLFDPLFNLIFGLNSWISRHFIWIIWQSFDCYSTVIWSIIIWLLFNQSISNHLNIIWITAPFLHLNIIWIITPFQMVFWSLMKVINEVVKSRHWSEVYDIYHTFLHVARVRKHTDMRELHAFRVQFSHIRVFSDLRNVQKRKKKSDTSGQCPVKRNSSLNALSSCFGICFEANDHLTLALAWAAAWAG